MATKQTLIAINKSAKKVIKKETKAILDKNLQVLKEKIGEKKFDKRLKKSVKILTKG